MRARVGFLVWIIAVLPLLNACSTPPRISFYLLDTGAPVPAQASSSLVVAIGPVDLPRYLDRPQIVTRTGGNRLWVDEFNRWGGSLDEDITRVLSRRIGDKLGTRRIYAHPSPVTADTDYRIALDIRTFDGTLGGDVVLEGSWSIIDDRSSEVVQTGHARHRSATAAADHAAYAAALSAVVVMLADELAEVIGHLSPPRSGR